MNIFIRNLLLILPVLMFMCGEAFAQKIKWSDIKKARGWEWMTLHTGAGTDMEGTYTFYRTNYEVSGFAPTFFAKYDHEFNRLFVTPLRKLDKMDGRKFFGSVDALKMDHGYLYFSEYWDKKSKEFHVYASDLDEYGILASPKKKLYVYKAPNKRKKGNANVVMSANKENLAVFHSTFLPFGDNLSYRFKLFGSDLSEKGEYTLSLPYKNRQLEDHQVIVGNNGKIYILLEITKSAIKTGEKFNPFELYVVDPVAGTSDVIDYVPEGKRVLSAKLASDNNGGIRGAGAYGREGEQDIEGLFTFSINHKTGNAESANLWEFESSLISEITNATKDPEMPRQLKIDHFELFPDGSAVIVAEKFYKYIRTYTNHQGYTSTSTVYNFENIVVMKLNGGSGQNWISTVPLNRQAANSYIHATYGFVTAGNMHYLIFNESNSRKHDYIIPKKMVTMVARIDENGKVRKSPIVNSKREKVYVIPDLTYANGDEELMLYSRKGRKYRFGRMKVK